jgi:putative ATP-dependent endonuclease of OLD family
MLFAKGIIFVEGIAEQLLIPCCAEYIGAPLEEGHVAVIGIGGLTFKHFLPLFGIACSQECALDRSVACLLDGDPMLKKRGDKHRKQCWPYQIALPEGTTECYAFSHLSDQTQCFPISGTVQKLKTACAECTNIRVFCGAKTLEFDLAMDNTCSSLLIDAVSTHRSHLLKYSEDPTGKHQKLDELLDEETKGALELLNRIPDIKSKATFSTYYLKCVESSKGEHAFDLAFRLKQNLEKPPAERQPLTIPSYIREGILWASGKDGSEVGS